MIINFSSGIKIKTSEFVYTPGEDTFFLEDCLSIYFNEKKMLENLSIIEVGCGSGYILTVLMKLLKNCSFIGIDINPYALDLTLQNLELNNIELSRIRLINSDLFSKVPEQLFNVIIFNPPYLPWENIEFNTKSDNVLKNSWRGGTPIINKFLTSTKEFLSPNGLIFLLLSNYQIKNDNPEDFIRSVDSKFQIIRFFKKILPMETLFVVILKINQFQNTVYH